MEIYASTCRNMKGVFHAPSLPCKPTEVRLGLLFWRLTCKQKLQEPELPTVSKIIWSFLLNLPIKQPKPLKTQAVRGEFFCLPSVQKQNLQFQKNSLKQDSKMTVLPQPSMSCLFKDRFLFTARGETVMWGFKIFSKTWSRPNSFSQE